MPNIILSDTSASVSELKKNSGTQFDPELVNVFIRLINEGKITV